MRRRTALSIALAASLLAAAPTAHAQAKWRAAGNFAVEHT